jgi:hypothetical protein
MIKQSTACSGDAINATSDKSRKGGMPHTPSQPAAVFFLSFFLLGAFFYLLPSSLVA